MHRLSLDARWRPTPQSRYIAGAGPGGDGSHQASVRGGSGADALLRAQLAGPTKGVSMARTLIVPGVSVTTEFDVAPPLPARSGVLGAVGVVDDASPGVGGVTARQELLELYGEATAFSFPEAVSALVNGVSEVVVSPVGGGTKASATLADDDGDEVVLLQARAPGPWADRVGVRVTRRHAPDGRTVRSVTVEVVLDDVVVETHDGLIVSAGHDQDLLTVLNRDSRVLVAIDPVFGLELPTVDADRVGFTDSSSAAAQRVLNRGGAPLLIVRATTPGAAGNAISVDVTAGRASAILRDAADAVALRVRRPEPGGPATAVHVTAGAGSSVDVTVLTAGVVSLSRTGLTDIAAVTEALETAGLLVDRTGDTLPAATADAVPLTETRTVTVRVEGVRTTPYEDLTNANEVVSALTADSDVEAELAPGADGTQRPDVSTAGENRYLSGGRDAGLARSYQGQTNPEAVLDLIPAPGTDGSATRFRVMPGAAPATVRIEAGVVRDGAFDLREAFDELVMDPDSPNYLPQVLADRSTLLRAIDRYPRTGVSTFPVDTRGVVRLSGGRAPTVDDYQRAIDALALEDAVDLVLAGLQGWADPNLDGVAVQQALLGHARAEADDAKPRIVIGSIPPALNTEIDAIVDHAGQVRDRRFVLVAPSGAEGAVAGLLGHLEFFQSPTFKTVASPGVPLVGYRESELNELLGPDGNVCVVTSRRGRGTIVVRGLTTDGSQISVIRVADRCVRETKAISDRFIGELNNAESRNALQQMIHARFAQLERDGALVPSVDGTSPAFQVEVYASQTDVAAGIARIDLAVRPVRSMDYVYARLRVRN